MSVSGLALSLLLAGAASAGDVGVTARFPEADAFHSLEDLPPSPVVYSSGESEPIAEPWDTALFHGESANAALAFEISRRLADGSWGPWQHAPLKVFADGRFWGKAELPAGPGSLRLRAKDGGIGARAEVRVYSVEVFSQGQQESGARSAVQLSSIPRPAVQGRSVWNAAPPREAYTAHAPARLTIHHTVGKQTFTLAESIAEVRFIQDYHQNGRGWSDIAYHYLIDSAGNVFEGRPEHVVGAHTLGANAGNVGIVILGYYHPPRDDVPQPAALDALVAVGRDLIARYGIESSGVKGHRDYKSTDCPGDGLYALLEQLRATLASPAPGVAQTSLPSINVSPAVTPQWD